MPVIWFTGFSGAGDRRADSNFQFDNSSSGKYSTPGIGNYINRMFGRMTNDPNENPHAPYIRAFGGRWGSGTYVGYVHAWLEQARWEPSLSWALTLGMTKPASGNCDFAMGVCLQTPPLSAGKDWRVGFRLYQTDPSYLSARYPLYFSNIAGTPLNFFTVPNVRNTPFYFEIEWEVASRTVTVFQDGVQVDQKVLSTSDSINGGFAIHTEMYYNGTGTQTRAPWFQISDMYWQTIESEADTALGPGTVVRMAWPASDDVVSFTRPEFYPSNANVVQVSTSSATDGTITQSNSARFLSGSGAGSQDLYNLDISRITDTMSRVEAVSVRSVSGNPGTIPMSYDAIAKRGSTQVGTDKGLTVLPSAPFAAKNLVMVADPSDGTRWDTTKLASLKIGTKIVS